MSSPEILLGHNVSANLLREFVLPLLLTVFLLPHYNLKFYLTNLASLQFSNFAHSITLSSCLYKINEVMCPFNIEIIFVVI